MALFRDEAPILDATRTKVDDLAQVASSTYSTIPQVHANIGVSLFSFSLTATSTSQPLFTVPFPIQILGVVSRFGTASSSGTLQIEETPSGTAVGSGTNLLTGTIALSGTANTNAFGTVATLTGGAFWLPRHHGSGRQHNLSHYCWHHDQLGGECGNNLLDSRSY